jgi:rhamnose utilization protein RhaD (predicted bifunctional aldolase and dehydrogenase)
MEDKILADLCQMSNHLGRPELDFAILGEGNSSARIDSETFFVKASGISLKDLKPQDLVKISFSKVFDLLEKDNLNDEEIRTGLKATCVDPTINAHPSVETFLHAFLLQLQGVNFIGHTHPAAVNAILCSQNAAEAYSGALFPDQIVYCGPAAVFVPYTDPGLQLAFAIRDHVDDYIKSWGEAPKVIVMQNHGFIALGESAKDVENITAMGVKTARILMGAYTLGGPHFLSAESVERIRTRPDEEYRKAIWRSK